MSLHSELKQQNREAFGQDPSDATTDEYAAYRKAEERILQTLVFFEGCAYSSYKDSNANPVDTIGIGNTVRPDGQKVRPTDKIKDADELMRYANYHLEKYVYPAMKKAITRDLSENEIAGVVSMVWNCGPGVLVDKNGKPTALARAINENDTEAIEREWMKHTKGKDGKVKKELVTRRPMELAMMAGKVDPKDLLICTYGGLDASKIIDKDGKPIKTEAAYNYMITSCSKPRPASLMQKYAWFNYGQPVENFVSGLSGSTQGRASEMPRVTADLSPVYIPTLRIIPELVDERPIIIRSTNER